MTDQEHFHGFLSAVAEFVEQEQRYAETYCDYAAVEKARDNAARLFKDAVREAMQEEQE